MNAGMELMGMKECRECGDPYTPAEPDTGVCSCCIMSHEVAALRARVAELERVQDAAFRDAHRAEADAARLREALEDIARVAYRGSAAASLARSALASAPSAEPDCSGLCSAPACGGHCGFAHAVGCEAIREYLAEHGGAPYTAPQHLPRTAPTPRDMRVAEAVRARIARHIRISPRFEGQLTTPNDNGLLGRVAQDVENLNLAAVVAKAVGT